MKRRTTLTGGILSLILMLIAGWQMSVLELWSYWSMLFLSAFWASIIFFLYPVLYRAPEGKRRILLSTLTGTLLALSFPPSVFTGLIFIAFIPLFYDFFERMKRKGKAAIRPFLWDSFHAMVVWNILATFWVANTALIPSFFAIWVNSLLMLIPMFIMAICVYRLTSRIVWAALVGPWILFEYLHMNWELSWSWLNLGNAFAGVPVAVQWYEYTGVLGGTLWVLVVNHLITRKIVQRGIHNLNWKSFIPAGLTILVPLVVSIILYSIPLAKSELEPVAISIVQPNFEPHYEKFEISEGQQLERILKLAESVTNKDTDYLILPETVFGGVDLSNIRSHKSIAVLMNWMAENYPELHLITGVAAYESVDSVTPYSREYQSRRGVMYFEKHNAALELNKDGLLNSYSKSKFVPGAEIFPYKNVLFFLSSLVDELGGSTAGYKPQDMRLNMDSGSSSLAPIICYESIYGEYCTEYSLQGAEILTILTNDGWWDNTPGHLQHLDYARLRAIEQRKPIARAANTGISAFIDPKGNLINPTEYNEAVSINSEIQPNRILTFYTRWGDLIGRFSLFAVIVLIMQLIASFFRKSRL